MKNQKDSSKDPLIGNDAEDARQQFRAARKAPLPSTVSTRIRQAGAAMYADESPYTTTESAGAYAEPAENRDVEADKGTAAYRIFIMLGVGVLFPWNAFISAFDYFSELYPKFPFEFIVSLAYNYPALLTLFLSIRYGPKFTFTTRTLTGLLTSLFALASVPLITGFLPRDVSLITMMVVIFMTGIASSLMFGGVLGLAAIFPPRFISAVMVGNGIAGIVVALLSIFSRLVFPDDEDGKRYSAYLYFALASTVILICIGLFFVLLRLPITRHYHAKHQASQRRAADHVVEDDSINQAAEVPSVVRATSLHGEDMEAVKSISSWTVLLRLGRHALSVWAVFFVTLALFPGIVMSIEPHQGTPAWQSWFPTVKISLFMLFDYVGRSTPSFWIPKSARYLWIAVMARFVFFVLFAFCVKPLYFVQDWIPCVIVALFAYTNGLLGTLTMMLGPSVVQPHERETAGIVMSFMLNFGIFCGVHTALGIRYILLGSIGLND